MTAILEEPPVINAQETIKILIVDDHQVVRLGIKTLIADDSGIEVVGEAGTVASAISEAARLSPQVVLLDIRLPDGSGFDACRAILSQNQDIKVLVLTSFADNEVVLKAIGAGASGYLLKEVNGEALIRAIKGVFHGQSVLDPAVTHHVLGRIKGGNPPVAEDKLAMLSAQERRVLALVAEGKTNKEIAAAMQLSDKTVKNYFSNILDKLHMSRRSQAAAFFVQCGLKNESSHNG